MYRWYILKFTLPFWEVKSGSYEFRGVFKISSSPYNVSAKIMAMHGFPEKFMPMGATLEWIDLKFELCAFTFCKSGE